MRMHIDRYEAAFMRLSVAVLVTFLFAIAVSVFGLGIQLPGAVDQLAPADVIAAPGFENPGLREIYPGKYEAYITVEAWAFTPAEITIPVGSELTLYLASKDIIHGLKVSDTNMNIMIIPGQISEVSHTFNKAGEYLYICHEYCGTLHHTMQGKIIVEEQ